ncbi:MAG: YdbH domain-containing protein, partial [Pseudomonadota bacterium]
LVPALKQTLRSVGGEGSAAGRLAWSNDGLASSGRALLDDVSVELSAAKISGVNGEATLASLLPPTTNGYQRLRIDSVVAGIELTGGVIDYALGADGLARISRADWKWGGGRLGVYDAVAALDGSQLRAPVEVRGVDLSAVLGALNVEGLSGDGRLTGVFPVALADGRLQVKDGRLSSEADGVLRYSGPQEAVALGVSAEQSELLFGALSNFQYKSIVMSLNGAIDDALTLKLTLDGANPDFLDGYPFKINLTTRADVSDVFKSD